MEKIPVRRGVGPQARPTEWTVAVVMLVNAVVMYFNDRNVAALVSVSGAALPTLITALATWYEQRHATTTTTVEATVDKG